MNDGPSSPLSELYPALEGPGLEYDLRPYTARNRFTLLSAPPKRGKSTFGSLYAHAKANAGEFLGQRPKFGTTLYVAPDENWRDVTRRFRSFGTPGELVHVWRARSRSVAAIAGRAAEIEADLVVLDTLLRVAGVGDENDNAAWDAWFDEARSYVEDSGAAWLAIHHDRKSGGKDGAGIRGASAIFGSVDVAISLQSTEDDRRRRILQVEGTRLDHADPLVIELNAAESRYDAVGEAHVVSIMEDSALERLRDVLTFEPQVVSTIFETLRRAHPDKEGDVSESAVRKRLEKLRTAGLAGRDGDGGRRDPYRYSLTRSQGPDETSERPREDVDEPGDTRSPDQNEECTDDDPADSRSLAHNPRGRERVSVENEAHAPEDLQADLGSSLGST